METTESITFEQVESLYERARFIYPEKKTALSPHWREIQDTWRKMLSSSNGIFRFYYRTRSGELSSSICIVQYCDRTWMIEHAVGVHDPGGVLGNLLEVSQWAADNNQCAYVRFLYRPTNRWPSRIFGQLMPKLRPGSYENHVYHYYTGTVSRRVPLIRRAGLTIDYLKPADYASFQLMLERHHSALLMDAKGLRCRDLPLAYASGKYALAGLTREREILLEKQEDRIIGYSLLEFSSLGINLSFLLNAFTPVVFAEDSVAEHNLVAASINHYLNKGRCFVVGLSESDHQAPFTNAGLSSMKQYAEMLISTEANFSGAVTHFRDYYRGIEGK
jgi:hypothetical protein